MKNIRFRNSHSKVVMPAPPPPPLTLPPPESPSGSTLQMQLQQQQQQKQRSETSSFRALMVGWAENTGMHGLPNITRSHSPLRRSVWVLLLLAGLSIMMWQIILVVQKYYQYPINVQKGTTIQLPRPFPAVSLCNKNPARQKRVRDSFESSSNSTNGSSVNSTESDGTSMGPGSVTGPTGLGPMGPTPPSVRRRKRDSGPHGGGKEKGRSPPPPPDATKYSWMTGSVVKNDSTRNLSALGPNVIPDRVGITYTFLDYYNSLTGDWKSKVGYQIKNFLIECSIGNRYCSPRDFTRFMHPLYGNCYTFNAAANGTKAFKVEQTGPLHGLTLTLFIDQTEYIGSVANSAGVSVVVHETNKQPFPEDSGINVSPGQETYIGLKQFYTKRLAAPYADDCQVNYDEANRLHNMYAVESNYSLPSVNYSQSACMKTCIQRQVEKMCNCSSPNMPISNPTIDPLYNASYSICLYEYNSTVSTISDNAKCMTKVEQKSFKQCLTNCKQDCDEYFYQTSLSVSVWPSDSYQSDSQRQIMSYNKNVKHAVEALKHSERRSFMSKNFVKVLIFYDDPVMYWSVSTPGYLIIDVLSDMGGQVGLWLGLSVLTLCEIVEMFVDLFYLCMHRSLQRKKSSTSGTGGSSGGNPGIKGGKVSDSSNLPPHQLTAGWYDMPAVEK